MAKKKPTSKRAKLLTDQAVGIAEFAAKANIVARELRIKTRPVKQFSLDENERATVAELPALSASLKKKLAKKDAAFTIIDVASMMKAISESVVGAEWKQQLLLAMKLRDCIQESIITPKAMKAPMNPKRITIISNIHGKITRDHKMSEPDIYWILDKWLERHPEVKHRRKDIQIVRGTITLLMGIKTDLISVSIVAGDDIAGYDPAQDEDLYAYHVSEQRDD